MLIYLVEESGERGDQMNYSSDEVRSVILSFSILGDVQIDIGGREIGTDKSLVPLFSHLFIEIKREVRNKTIKILLM